MTQTEYFLMYEALVKNVVPKMKKVEESLDTTPFSDATPFNVEDFVNQICNIAESKTINHKNKNHD
jgi:hypothetical protein